MTRIKSQFKGAVYCLWNELGAIYGLWNGSWCVAGDFNAILNPEERSTGGSFNSDMRRFADVIENLQLKNLPLFGGPFTWSGGMNNQSFSRLDRFLINEEWDCQFSGSRQCVRPLPNPIRRRGCEKRSIPFQI